MIEALRKLDKALGAAFQIEVRLDDNPTSVLMNLGALAEELARRMICLFLQQFSL